MTNTSETISTNQTLRIEAMGKAYLKAHGLLHGRWKWNNQSTKLPIWKTFSTDKQFLVVSLNYIAELKWSIFLFKLNG